MTCRCETSSVSEVNLPLLDARSSNSTPSGIVTVTNPYKLSPNSLDPIFDSLDVGTSTEIASGVLTPSALTMLLERASVRPLIAETMGERKGATRALSGSVAMIPSSKSPSPPLRMSIISNQELSIPAVILTFGISTLRTIPFSSSIESSLSVSIL